LQFRSEVYFHRFQRTATQSTLGPFETTLAAAQLTHYSSTTNSIIQAALCHPSEPNSRNVTS
jgi:hypothetical protein